MSTSSFININNSKFEDLGNPPTSLEYQIIEESKNSTKNEEINHPKFKKENITNAMKLKYPIFSLIGIICSLIFMVIAYSVYDGEHASGVVSFLGSIETNPAARSFFGLSLLTVGITIPYFCKSINQIFRERNNFGLRMGKLSSIAVFGIAIFEMHQQGNLHRFFAYGGFLVILSAMLFYSIKLWRYGGMNGKFTTLFFIGSVEIPLIMIIEMIIMGIIFNNPVIIGSFEKAAILSLFLTILYMNVYILIRFRKNYQIDPKIKEINPFRDINDAKKIIILAREALFSTSIENRKLVVR